MNKQASSILIYVFIGVIILGGVFYFVSLFSKDDENKKEVSLNDFKDEKDVFSSKKDAYDTYIDDSIVNVRKENVSVDINSLFSKKQTEQPQDLIPEDEEPNQVQAEVSRSQTSKPVSKVITRSYTEQDYRPMNYTYQPKSENQDNSNSSSSNSTVTRRESFNSFSEERKNTTSENKEVMIKAVVHSKQTVYPGATVKLRSTSPFSLNGMAIPENTIIYGSVSIMEERVLIKVSSINFNGSILPVSLLAYDRDGMEGVYIPGLAQHEVKNETVNEAISEAQAALNVPHIATVPLNVARNRNRQATAILTDSYQIILK